MPARSGGQCDVTEHFPQVHADIMSTGLHAPEVQMSAVEPAVLERLKTITIIYDITRTSGLTRYVQRLPPREITPAAHCCFPRKQWKNKVGIQSAHETSNDARPGPETASSKPSKTIGKTMVRVSATGRRRTTQWRRPCAHPPETTSAH